MVLRLAYLLERMPVLLLVSLEREKALLSKTCVRLSAFRYA